ncbi:MULTISPECIES: APC family permease [Pseudomonas]|uniref:Amino acid permease n=1 Tax=Pseudomonas putida TaxID=303 RepID=A0A2S3XCW6_PSEPU|nr:MULTISPECIES: APC family permease [Pseudomonas]AVD83798.1 amino acid permease [Pseudomonas sp. SWI6]AVD95032.1 amino acid permease [Pseudomonas sp. SWI36]ELU0814726.1 APC family permease [Pseudomonas putida]MBH3388259.1 APC family permease [Pseudomonas putida]MCK2121402.1 APC family permease [Pseudomonas sp. PNPG3]
MGEVEKQKLKGSLGVTPIVMMVVATAAPLTVMVANTPLMVSLGNGIAAPVDAFIATVIMFLFTVGFVAMSKYISNAGAFYAFIQKGLGRSVGLGSATLAVVSYALILVALQGYIGYTSAAVVNDFLGVSVPWWVYSLMAVGVIACLGYRDIELSSKFLGIALVLEIAVVILVDIAVILDKGPTGLESASFHLDNIISGSPGLGILFAIFSFIGFESTVIYREEAKDPDRTIPRATYTAVLLVGAFYVISMWCAVSSIGKDNITAFSEAHGADMYLAVTEHYFGVLFMDVMHVLLITSLFACALSLHNIVVRYKYTLGRFGVLNDRFSSVHPEHGSPHVSSIVLSLFSVIAFALLIAIGADPASQIYAWGAMAGTLGYMAILSLTCAAVVVFFRREQVRGQVWKTLIAPSAGLLGILGCLWVAVSNLPDLIGGDSAKTVSIFVVSFLLATFAFGFWVAERFRTRHPVRYEALRQLA